MLSSSAGHSEHRGMRIALSSAQGDPLVYLAGEQVSSFLQELAKSYLHLNLPIATPDSEWVLSKPAQELAQFG